MWLSCVVAGGVGGEEYDAMGHFVRDSRDGRPNGEDDRSSVAKERKRFCRVKYWPFHVYRERLVERFSSTPEIALSECDAGVEEHHVEVSAVLLYGLKPQIRVSSSAVSRRRL
jgi:hypothetical protein